MTQTPGLVLGLLVELDGAQRACSRNGWHVQPLKGMCHEISATRLVASGRIVP
jgi:hypothetical protein